MQFHGQYVAILVNCPAVLISFGGFERHGAIAYRAECLLGQGLGHVGE